MASISSAGVGSNLPLNDLIQAELSAKKTQFERRIVGRETRLNSNLSGIGQLKSAISTFNAALQKLAKPADFSGNKVTIGQSADNQLLAFTATNKANTGNYNIAVKQLATGSSFISADNAFTSSSDIATSSAGT
ncbi:TPA: flagellar cap protein FliD N-terminal domain-containing protein, partial [Aeromonas veronii]